MKKSKVRMIVLLLLIFLIMCVIIFRDQISAFLQNLLTPIGPGGLPPEIST